MPMFIPSSDHLTAQIAAATAKCDADLEQTALREEARKEARAVRAWVAEAKARNARKWL